ncbi:hypothetical protein F5880DRAFT_1301891 [Lentinula raphanica]|nr:hypothetical protein F5880DRAFT_1301891 [Lentinula raphanica]
MESSTLIRRSSPMLRTFFLAILALFLMYFVMGTFWFITVALPVAVTFIGSQLRVRARLASNSIGCIGILVGILLQLQNSRFALSVYSALDVRRSLSVSYIVKFFMCSAVLADDASEEKEQLVRWLHYSHRALETVDVNDDIREQSGKSKDVTTSGCVDESYTSLLDAITWSTLSFHEHFGNPMSKRVKDDIVLDYACLGMRLGIPQNALSKDYDTFESSFRSRSLIYQTLMRPSSTELGVSTLQSRSHLLNLSVHAGLAIGIEILPKHIREEYMSVFFKSWHTYMFQRCVVWLVWMFYPLRSVLPPLRSALCLLILLDQSAWSSFLVSSQMKFISVVIEITHCRTHVNNYVQWILWRVFPSASQEIRHRTLIGSPWTPSCLENHSYRAF